RVQEVRDRVANTASTPRRVQEVRDRVANTASTLYYIIPWGLQPMGNSSSAEPSGGLARLPTCPMASGPS
ncbi:hypothetical protein AVEN_53512-1, partial [Araneus ventricosus]